jgi:plastocyanin
MRLTRALTVAAFAATVTLLPTSSAAATGHTVSMSNFAFAPAALTIQAGDSVTWTNHDTAPHDVTVTNGPVSIHSPTVSTGQSWTYTFTVVGTYSYICSIHPDMRAALTVTSPPAATPTRTVAVQQPAVPRAVGQSTTAAQPHAATSSKPPTPHTAPPTTSPATPVAPAPVAASTTARTGDRTLKPLLIVAGVVAAVATFCLLVLASRPDDPSAD